MNTQARSHINIIILITLFGRVRSVQSAGKARFNECKARSSGPTLSGPRCHSKQSAPTSLRWKIVTIATVAKATAVQAIPAITIATVAAGVPQAAIAAVAGSVEVVWRRWFPWRRPSKITVANCKGVVLRHAFLLYRRGA
jgi:hypothetical protein